jgi:D-3-phosphoglycerate dehydrogenase
MQAVLIDRTPELRRILAERQLPVPEGLTFNEGYPKPADIVRIGQGKAALLIEHTPVPAEVLDALPDLRAIVFMGTGVGSYVDVADARRRGIQVLTTPGYGDRAVAEHALALLFAGARRIAAMDAALRAGTWQPLGGLQLQGRKVAVVGLGGIGTAFADLALALGMQVSAWNRAPKAHPAFEPDLDTALAGADVVSLHLVLNEGTRGILNARHLQLPKPGFILVNTARAALVDEGAQMAALDAGQIGHAALDVFHREPLGAGHPYARRDDVTLTAHAAYMTDDAYVELWRRTLLALESVRLPGR